MLPVLDRMAYIPDHLLNVFQIDIGQPHPDNDSFHLTAVLTNILSPGKNILPGWFVGFIQLVPAVQTDFRHMTSPRDQYSATALQMQCIFSELHRLH